MNHREEYEEYKKGRSKRVIIGYVIGIVALLLHEFLRNSPRIAELMEIVNRSENVDDAFYIQILAALLHYVLPTVGISALLITTYLFLFKRDDSV